MTHETENSTWSTSVYLIRQIIPDNYELFWQDADILNGKEHDIVHHIMVLGLVNYVGKMLIAKGGDIDLLALNATALVHDTQRISEDEDTYHGLAAEGFLEDIKNMFWPFTSFWQASPQSIELARQITFFHNLKPEKVPPGIRNNLTFRVFEFCDVLAMVRYNGWDGKFEVTPKMLQEKLPNRFSTDELKQLLVMTQNCHALAQKYYQEGQQKIEAILTAGKETGLFT